MRPVPSGRPRPGRPGAAVLGCLIAALLVTGILAACTADPPAPVPGPGTTTSVTPTVPPDPDDPARTLVVGVDDLGPGFNPHRLADLSPVSHAITSLVLPSVFRPVRPDATPASTAGTQPAPSPLGWTMDPSLATSAQVTSTAPFTVTYQLRREAQWSDGAPIAAEDFRYLWQQMITQPGVVDPAGYTLIDDVGSSEGGKTVTVKFRAAYPGWQSLFDGLLPSHLLKDSPGGFAGALDDNLPVSGSRFGVARVDRDRGEVQLVRNDRFWDSPALPGEILLRRTSTVTQLASSLRSNNTQVALVHGADATLAQLGLVPDVRTAVVAQPAVLGVTANTTSALLSDTGVREAVFGLLDPAALSVIGSGGVNAAPSAQAQVLAPAAYGYRSTAPPRPTVAQATAQLADKGFADVDGTLRRGGTALSLTVGADESDPTAVAIAQAAADQLTAAGVAATALSTDSASLFGVDLTQGRVDLIVSRAPAGDDPAAELVSRFGCPKIQAPVATAPSVGAVESATPTSSAGSTTSATTTTTTPAPSSAASPDVAAATAARGGNVSGLCAPALQPQLDAALQGTTDITALLDQLEPVLWDQHVYLPLYQDSTVFSARTELTGIDLGAPLAAGPFASAPNWSRTGS